MNFALCAIGDSSYDTFAKALKKLISAIQDCDAKAFVDKIQIDVQLDPVPEDPALAWLSTMAAGDFKIAYWIRSRSMYSLNPTYHNFTYLKV